MMPWNRRNARRDDLLQQILTTQKCMENQLREIAKMAANAVTQDQFKTDLGKLQSDTTTLVTTVNALDGNVKQLKADVAALKDQIANGQTPDFSSLDATVNQMDNTIATANANVQAEVPNPDAPADGGAIPPAGDGTGTEGGSSTPPAA
jgi:chromosome segregation ATPase